MTRLKSATAGLGVSGLLVISLVLLLVVGGAVTSFSGWDFQGSRGGGSRDLVVRDARSPAAAPADAVSSADPSPRRAARARKPAATPGAGRRPAAVGRTIGAVRVPAPADRQRVGGVAPRRGGNGTPSPSSPVPPPTRFDPDPAMPPGAEPDTLPGRVGDITETLTNGLGTTIMPVSPDLGETLMGTGETVSDLLRELGG